VAVVASGEAPVGPGDLISTKERALIEVQRNAVEMAAGVHSERDDGELYTVKIKARVRINE
jgi:hypothetical protein